MMSLSEGNEIPNFVTTNELGEEISKQSLLGQKYILFFYPKDDSPGCTKEACSIRDNFKRINKQGYEVYGISPDTEKKHSKFKEKYEFQFSLLSDPDKEVIQSFGLWGPKKFMGREITGVYRTTLIVNESSKIQKIISKVKTKEHGQQILDALEEIAQN
jgi:peroxiredoxin Q/BCP